MLPISEVDWGPIDAADHDENFYKKFIEPEELRALLDRRVVLIVGEKGAGKTAFMKGFLHNRGAEFSSVKKVALDEIEASPIVHSVAHLTSLSQVKNLTFMTNLWKCVFIIEGAKKVVKKDTKLTSRNWLVCRDYLRKNGLMEHGLFATLLIMANRAWEMVELATRRKPEKLSEKAWDTMPSSLHPQVIEALRDYPFFDPEFSKFSEAFSSYLEETDSKLLIFLDGLDRLDTEEERQKDGLRKVFNGLAQAAYDLSISQSFQKTLQIKLLFPQDRYLSLSLRDLDKVQRKSKHITWTHDSLQDFLSKRMALHPKMPKEKFEKQWVEVMPAQVENKFYGVPENSYEYILRHTMYRPRHLQYHLDYLSVNYAGKIVDANIVPQMIRESCRDIARGYIQEYAVDHPNLGDFIRMLRGKKNIMPLGEFVDILKKAIERFGANEKLMEKVVTLYRIGFFGVIKWNDEQMQRMQRFNAYTPPRKSSTKPYRVDFYYKDRDDNAALDAGEETLLAIHPALTDFAQLDPHPDLIVG